MKLVEVLKAGEDCLVNAGIADGRLDAWYLMEHVFNIDRVSYLMKQQVEADSKLVAKYQDLIELRKEHIPLQHIVGVQEFMGLEFDVNEHVLIPRQDTECLVERVMKYSKDATVLDVCTGSGCIIISLEKLGRIQHATAVDISPEALAVARNNANKLGAKVKFLESDLFSQIHEKYDIIVSNPPYIPSKVVDTLMEEVRDHEPRIALDGKEDGLYFYRELIQQAPDYLNAEGMLFFEIGHDQGNVVKELMQERGFVDVMVEKDLAGLDRVVYGKLQKG